LTLAVAKPRRKPANVSPHATRSVRRPSGRGGRPDGAGGPRRRAARRSGGGGCGLHAGTPPGRHRDCARPGRRDRDRAGDAAHALRRRAARFGDAGDGSCRAPGRRRLRPLSRRGGRPASSRSSHSATTDITRSGRGAAAWAWGTRSIVVSGVSSWLITAEDAVRHGCCVRSWSTTTRFISYSHAADRPPSCSTHSRCWRPAGSARALAPGVPRCHGSRGESRPLAPARRGVRGLELLRAARLAQGRAVGVGGSGSRALARTSSGHLDSDRHDRGRYRVGHRDCTSG
jgi:hypothetical protein